SSGSVRSSHTVSGLAAISICRSTIVLSVVASTLAALLSFGLAPQRLKPLVPESLEELPQLGEPFAARLVQAPGAVPPFVHETRPLQNGEVLRDRGAGDVEVRRDLAGRELPVADQHEDLSPPRLGNRLECCLHT